MNRSIRLFTTVIMALQISAVAAWAAPYVRSVSRTSVTRTTHATKVNDNAVIHKDVSVTHVNTAVPVSRTVVGVPVVGTTVYSIPSSEVVVVKGVTYYKSGSIWYQPVFTGTAVTYVVIADPQ